MEYIILLILATAIIWIVMGFKSRLYGGFFTMGLVVNCIISLTAQIEIDHIVFSTMLSVTIAIVMIFYDVLTAFPQNDEQINLICEYYSIIIQFFMTIFLLNPSIFELTNNIPLINITEETSSNFSLSIPVGLKFHVC
jgi:hypothetical protein